MKLSEYAKKNSISYLTAYRHWRKGYIKGKQLESGTIVVMEESETKAEAKEKRTIKSHRQPRLKRCNLALDK